MDFVISPPSQASIAIVDSDARFPVRRIFCVGRNYEAHAKEMGHHTKEAPFFFCKPADAVVDTPCSLEFPSQTQDLHYEIELVIAIAKAGKNIPQEQVISHIWGAGVGVDLTRRDLQKQAKEKGRPWDMAKGFDQSAPMSPLIPLSEITSLSRGRIWLSCNDVLKQDADIAEMIWPVLAHISILSQSVALAAGDLIMTGTPAGVGPVKRGDCLRGGVDGINTLEVSFHP